MGFWDWLVDGVKSLASSKDGCFTRGLLLKSKGIPSSARLTNAAPSMPEHGEMNKVNM
jgi:hypothetical protein